MQRTTLISATIAMLFLCLTVSIAFADEVPAPVPDSKIEALSGLKKHLEQQKSEEKEIKQTLRAAREEIKSTRNRLVSISTEIRRSEEEMASLEKHVESLNRERSRLKQSLNKDRVKSSRLALALQRISQVPPEALMARPASPVQTVHSGILIQSSIPLLQKEAKRLKRNLDKLKEVSTQLVADRKSLLQTRQRLNEQKTKLAVYLRKRQDFYKKTQSRYDNIHSHIAEISAQAESLEELVKKMESQKEITPPRPLRKAAFKTNVTPPRPLENNLSPRLPASGIIQTAFGDKTGFGATSRGLKIRTRDGGLVVSPMAGVVKFAGEFGKFGRVVIIRHEDGYHSLISGLYRLSTSAGQRVMTGEPVGLMGSSIAGRKPVLYYELRRSGKPVDPSVKFSGLS